MQVLAGSARGWILPFILFALHNLEEVVLDLPAWGKAQFAFLADVPFDRSDMAIAVGVLMAGLLLVAYAVRHDAERTARLQRLFLLIVAAVFCWHIGVSLWAGSLQPGVITSVLFLPVYLWLIHRSARIVS